MSLHFPCQKFTQLATSLHFPCQKFELFVSSFTLPVSPFLNGYPCDALIRNEFTLFVAKTIRPLSSDSLKWHEPRDESSKPQDKWSNPTHCHTDFPFEKMNQTYTQNYWKKKRRRVARGNKPYLRKIYRSQSTNQSSELSERLPDLCFAICRYSEGKLITPMHVLVWGFCAKQLPKITQGCPDLHLWNFLSI